MRNERYRRDFMKIGQRDEAFMKSSASLSLPSSTRFCSQQRESMVGNDDLKQEIISNGLRNCLKIKLVMSETCKFGN